MSSQGNSESDLYEIDSACYQVQCIKQRKIVKGKKMYFVKWRNWQDKDNTWEPIENLKTVIGMVNEFDKQADIQQSQKANKKGNYLNNLEKSINSSQSQIVMKTKTKPIQKEKEKPIRRKSNRSQSGSQRESQNQSSRSSSSDKRKKNSSKPGKKSQVKKSSSLNQGEKTVSNAKKHSQKQRQKERQKQKQQKDNRQKQKLEPLSNPSKSTATNNPIPTNTIPYQIVRINYHIFVDSQQANIPAKLYYNVDRISRFTKKQIPVADVDADYVKKHYPALVVDYLENYVMDLELQRIEDEEYKNLIESNQNEQKRAGK